VKRVAGIGLDRTLVWSRLYCVDTLSTLGSFINRFIDGFFNNEKCVDCIDCLLLCRKHSEMWNIKINSSYFTKLCVASEPLL